jgi:hypothetical protein
VIASRLPNRICPAVPADGSVPQMEAIVRTTTKPRVSRILAWLRDTWAELDYAQRRMFELNLAIPALRPPPDRADVDELEALYALPSRDPED